MAEAEATAETRCCTIRREEANTFLSSHKGAV